MFGLSPVEMVLIGVVAVLLFGKNLPEVGKKIGRGLAEFRKSYSGIQNEFYDAMNDTSSNRSSRGSRPSSTPKTPSRFNEIDDRDEATAPKFEPPPSAPLPDAAPSSPEPSHVSNGETV